MLRLREDVGSAPVFDDLAMTHDGDRIAYLRRDAQVVGDEEHRKAEALANVRKKTQHLRLHRDVERGYRLVGNENLRVECQRPRESDQTRSDRTCVESDSPRIVLRKHQSRMIFPESRFLHFGIMR